MLSLEGVIFLFAPDSLNVGGSSPRMKNPRADRQPNRDNIRNSVYDLFPGHIQIMNQDYYYQSDVTGRGLCTYSLFFYIRASNFTSVVFTDVFHVVEQNMKIS